MLVNPSLFSPGVRSRSRSRSLSESWQRARSRSRSRSKCLGSDSGTFCLNLWHNLPMKGRICMHFLEIISADIVFKFCRHTHIRINRGGDWEWGAVAFKGASKEAKRSHTPPPSPKAPEMAQNQHVPRYNKKTKQ